MLTAKQVGKLQTGLQEDAQEHAAFIFEALGDPTRLKIFRLLAKHKDLCVTDIANVLQVSLPAASYQMKMFEMVGLVKKERMGQMICYELKTEDPFVKRILKVVE